MTDFLGGRVVLHGGDCREVIRSLADSSIDSVVCDPPYALVSIVKRFGKPGSVEAKGGVYQRSTAGFMGKQWDNGEAAFAAEFWAEVLRVLKPGGHVLAFSGTRTYHRLAVAVEDAGFEIRDQIGWAYGSGFPKSHNVGKGIDRHLGHERTKVRIEAAELRNPPNLVGGAVKGEDRPWRQAAIERGFHEAVSDEAVSDEAVEWDGWGTALKPAWEPIVMARKPLRGTVAENVLEHGTGALNIDGCRVEGTFESGWSKSGSKESENGSMSGKNYDREPKPDSTAGRWPANIIHDGSDEVLAAFPDSQSSRSEITSKPGAVYGNGSGLPAHTGIYGFDDSGSAARFFYTAKADGEDRLGSKHPTVKPLDLMQYLVRLVTPPGGLVLDPFAGTGTTGEAAFREGRRAVLIEREPEYQADIARRMDLAENPTKRAAVAKSKNNLQGAEGTPLFGGISENIGGGAGSSTASSLGTDNRSNRTQTMSEDT